MMSVAANTAAVSNIPGVVSDQIASGVATINAAIAANSMKIAANMMSVAANTAAVNGNTTGVQMISNDVLSRSMVSPPDAALL